MSRFHQEIEDIFGYCGYCRSTSGCNLFRCFFKKYYIASNNVVKAFGYLDVDFTWSYTLKHYPIRVASRLGSSQDMEPQSFTVHHPKKETTASTAKKTMSSTKISDHYIVLDFFFFVDGLFGSIHVMFNLNTVNFVEGVGKFLSKRGVWCRCLQLWCEQRELCLGIARDVI